MIKSEFKRNKYVNDVTRFFDKHIRKCRDYDPYNEFFHHYVYPEKFNNSWTIRIPGMSVAGIHVDGDIIKDIRINEDNTYLYEKEIYDGLKQFIGKTISF